LKDTRKEQEHTDQRERKTYISSSDTEMNPACMMLGLPYGMWACHQRSELLKEVAGKPERRGRKFVFEFWWVGGDLFAILKKIMSFCCLYVLIKNEG